MGPGRAVGELEEGADGRTFGDVRAFGRLGRGNGAKEEGGVDTAAGQLGRIDAEDDADGLAGPKVEGGEAKLNAGGELGIVEEFEAALGADLTESTYAAFDGDEA